MPLSLCSLNTSLRITFSTEFGVIWLAWILFPFLSFGGRLSTWYLHLDHLYYSLDVVNKFSHFSLLGSYSKAPENREYDALRIIFDTKFSFRLTRKAHSLSIHGTQPMQNPNIYWIWRKKIVWALLVKAIHRKRDSDSGWALRKMVPSERKQL